MKLIDILVLELPKRGGWPAEAIFAMQDSDGLVKFSRSDEKIYHDHDDGHEWCSVGGYDWIRDMFPFEGNFRTQVSHDNVTAFISREKYEAALATSKPEWNGNGLPPVGMEIEYKFTKVNYRTDFSRGKVLAYGMHNVFMEHWSSKNEFIQPLDKIEFRPIRSEEDKKRDEAVTALHDEYFSHAPIDKVRDVLYALYDAIAAGKIPHIRID